MFRDYLRGGGLFTGISAPGLTRLPAGGFSCCPAPGKQAIRSGKDSDAEECATFKDRCGPSYEVFCIVLPVQTDTHRHRESMRVQTAIVNDGLELLSANG